MSNINIYGVLHNDTPEGIIAKAAQIKDDALNRLQSDINQDVHPHDGKWTSGMNVTKGHLVIGADGVTYLAKVNTNKDPMTSKGEDGDYRIYAGHDVNLYTEENPEWADVILDAEGRFLVGIRVDGSFDFAKGIPGPIQKEFDKINQSLGEITEGNLSDKIDTLKEVFKFVEDFKDTDNLFTKLQELNTKIEDNKTELTELFTQGQEEQNNKITEGFNEVNEKLDDHEERIKAFESIIYNEENPEYVEVTLDADGKLLEAIEIDGTKYFPNRIKQGKTVTEFIDNPEYIEATVDADGKLLEGMTVEGQKYLGKPSNQDEKLQRQIDETKQQINEELTANIDSLTEQINKNILTIDIDNKTGDVIATCGADDSAFEDGYIDNKTGDIILNFNY